VVTGAYGACDITKSNGAVTHQQLESYPSAVISQATRNCSISLDGASISGIPQQKTRDFIMVSNFYGRTCALRVEHLLKCTVKALTYLSTLRLCASILQSLPRELGGSKHRHSCFRSERWNLANAGKKINCEPTILLF
jgi:hypothetical protein